MQDPNSDLSAYITKPPTTPPSEMLAGHERPKSPTPTSSVQLNPAEGYNPHEAPIFFICNAAHKSRAGAGLQIKNIVLAGNVIRGFVRRLIKSVYTLGRCAALSKELVTFYIMHYYRAVEERGA